MLRKTLALVKQEFRPLAAFNDVARIASHHRIQCSPGFRDAARHIQSTLSHDGVKSEILTFPAKAGVKWWSQDSFPEWEGRDAELILLEDGKEERLCLFSELKTSLIQRSAPTPKEGLRTSMVYIEKATEASAYDGIDVAGKLVFSQGPVSDIAAVAVDRFGAAGIVVDNIRDGFGLPDARQYLSFWPGSIKDHKTFGFVISRRQGDALRKKFSSGKKELAVFARVDSRLFDGSMEVVSAVIEGKQTSAPSCQAANACCSCPEEVVAIAHLCHPESSANDNASGSGALMEAARTLSRLISDGRLPAPNRTIRFLWVPEMTGSYAYLSVREDSLSKIVAAINLDMVGENQDLCGSTFNVERPVSALPGFGGDLAEAIIRLMANDVENLAGTRSYSSFRWAVSPFSGGSDHNIWGDPAVGVTCPMLIQWPDKFYHTSEDTIDKVDPKMLGVAGILTATYLYTAACASSADAGYVAGEMATNFAEQIENVLTLVMDQHAEAIRAASTSEGKTDALAKARREVERRTGFLADRKREDVGSLLKLAPDSPMFANARKAAQDMISGIADFLKGKYLTNLTAIAGLDSVSDLPPAWDGEEEETVRRAKSIVPVRACRGLFSSTGKATPQAYKEASKAFYEKYPGQSFPPSSVQYWADGKRTLYEVADLLEGETGLRNLAMLVDYYELAVKRGIFRPS